VAPPLGWGGGRRPPPPPCAAPRGGPPRDPVVESRDAPTRIALSLNAAFAGANCAVVLGAPAAAARTSARADRPVFVLGAAVLAGEHRALAALRLAIDRRDPVAHRVAPFRLEADLPMADVRGMDPSTRYLAAVAARALGDACVTLRGEQRDRAAIFSSVTAFSASSGAEFRRSVDQRGLPRVNATAFAKLVLNAPAGVAAKLLSLRGPTTTVTTGRGGGGVAVACAAELLAHGAGADVVVAAAVDELGPEEEASIRSEGAAALVLGTTPPERDRVRLRRWALAAPGDGVADAVRAVLGGEEPELVLTDHGDVAVRAPCIALAPLLGDAPSATLAVACALAFDAIRSGAVARVLVVSRGGGGSVALWLERGET